MKTVIKSVVALTLVLAMCLTLVGCNNDKKDINNLILEFEYACNTLDFDAVLNCIDPKISDNIRLAGGVIGMFTQTDTDEMFEKLSEYLLNDESIESSEFFSSISIDIQESEIDGENAVVSTKIKYKLADVEMEREADFYCIYYNEKWYISDFAIL